MPPQTPRGEWCGALVIVGGGVIPQEIIDRFLELGGGIHARVVLITTASAIADQPVELETRLLPYWHELPKASLSVLHTRSRDVANDEAFSRVLDEATAVWFIGGNQLSLTEVYLNTKVEERLRQVIQRGGVIGGTSAGAAIMSRIMIGGNTPQGPYLTEGLGFLPGVIIDQHFLKRNRLWRLEKALDRHPSLVGIGIDEGTALVVTPRKVEVLGESHVIVCLRPHPERPTVMRKFSSGDTIDLNRWSLAAVNRAQSTPTGAKERRRLFELPRGSVLISGSALPAAAVDAFIRSAGGPDAPLIILVGDDSDSATVAGAQRLLEAIHQAGADNVQLCRLDGRHDTLSPDLEQRLQDARGVWFLGSEQHRTIDWILQTQFDRVMKGVLSRGGVIAGSAAAATIQGEGMLCQYELESEMEEDDPLGEIYTCGLGTLPGFVIGEQRVDTTWAKSLTRTLRQRFPWCLGLGLQESAAVLVRGHTLTVLGDDSVALIGEPGDDEHEEEVHLEQLSPGDVYDLRSRTRLIPNNSTEPNMTPESASR